MKKSKLAELVDDIALLAGTWLLAIAISGYWIHRLYLRAILGAVIAFSICAIIRYVRSGKANKRDLTKRAVETMKLLSLNDKMRNDRLLLCALSHRGQVDYDGQYIYSDKTVYYVNFAQRGVTADDIVQAYWQCIRQNKKRLVIISGSEFGKAERQVISHLDSVKIIRATDEEIYVLLSQAHCLPTSQNKSNKDLIGFFKSCLYPEKARGYASACAILLIGSSFSPLSVYYIAISCVCLALAFACRIDILKLTANRKNN